MYRKACLVRLHTKLEGRFGGNIKNAHDMVIAVRRKRTLRCKYNWTLKKYNLSKKGLNCLFEFHTFWSPCSGMSLVGDLASPGH
jgi:hypothetical protein